MLLLEITWEEIVRDIHELNDKIREEKDPSIRINYIGKIEEYRKELSRRVS